MKVKGLSYRMAKKLIVPALLLLGLLAWQLAFKRTAEVYRNYQALRQASGGEDPLSISPGYTRARAAALDRIYRRYLVDTLHWKDRLWNECAGWSARYNCPVLGFPDQELLMLDGDTLRVQGLIFSGAYADLIRLQQELDTARGIGKIGSLAYRRDPRTLQTTLNLQLFALPLTTE